MTEAAAPPPGFAVHDRTSPFLTAIGPLYSRRGDGGIEFALRVDERHLNARGSAHGGVLAGLADVALGYTASVSQDPPVYLSTATLTIDFAGSVEAGEIIVAIVDVQRVGRRLAFANCYLTCREKRVARASAVFAVVAPPA